MTDYHKRLEGKLAQLASRAEIMRQFADQFADKADAYWQTAEADATGYELEAADLRKLLAEGNRVREALEPFALAGATLSSRWQDHETHWQDALSYGISAGQLRAARQALGDTE